MIARVSTAKSGFSEYLITGRRKDSEFWRDDKDEVIPIYGNLDVFANCEKFLNKNKNYKSNYMHISLSFSKDDILKIENLDEFEKNELYYNLTTDYLKHYVSGYDIENVVAYAELHNPKIKFENNKERLAHIHLGIMLYDFENEKKIVQAPFNLKLDRAIQNYCNSKYGLTDPQTKLKTQVKESITAKNRQMLIESTKDIKNQDELIAFFKEYQINFREVKTAKNHYFKVILKEGEKAINLRGRGFEHLNFDSTPQQEKEQIDDESLLKKFYERREEQIDKIREKQKLATKEFQEFQTQPKKQNLSNSFTSYQNKIAFNIYKSNLKFDFKGFYVDSRDEKVIFKKSGINVEDRGNKLTAKGTDTKEQVKLMLEIAQAKKWNLALLEVSGDDEFKQEAQRQINEILLKKQKGKEEKFEEIEDERLIAPIQPIQNIAKQDTPSNFAQNDDLKLDSIKNNTNDDLKQEKQLTSKEIIKKVDEKQKTKFVFKSSTPETTFKKPLEISICEKPNEDNATSGWKTIKVNRLAELSSICKKYPYSNAKFENGYRKSDSDNVRFGNLLIFDVNNDANTPNLTIEQAKDHFRDLKYPALIISTKSHQKEKNGRIADRYRIIIPTQESIDSLNKDEYKKFQKLVAKELKIFDFIDKSALNDVARCYEKSSIFAVQAGFNENAEALSIRTTKIYATEDIKNTKAKEAKIAEIKANSCKYKTIKTQSTDEKCFYLDDKGMSVILNDYSIGDIVKVCEGDNAKYSILEDENLIHDFKSNETLNVYSYLANHLKTDDVNLITKKFYELTGEQVLKANIDLVKEHIELAKRGAVNDKTFEEALKKSLGVNFVKLHYGSGEAYLQIADVKLSAKDLGFESFSKDVIATLKANRSKYEKKQEKRMQR